MEFLNTSNSESIFNFNNTINDKDDIMNLDNSFLSDYSFDIFKSNFKINVIIFINIIFIRYFWFKFIFKI